MTEQQHREAHEAFMKRLDALDRQYAPDAPESPEEAEWNEKRMEEINKHIHHEKTTNKRSNGE